MSVISGGRPIVEKRYANPLQDWVKICDSLPQFDSQLAHLSPFISENLAETNTAIIEAISKFLAITTPIVCDLKTSKKGSDRLIELCSFFGADVYLSGPSGRNYLDLKKFEDAKIEVRFF